MSLEETIKESLARGEVVIGSNKCKKIVKTGKPKLVVLAKNAPEDLSKEIRYNAKVSGIKVEVFDGTSRELGILCGRPYPISILVIK